MADPDAVANVSTETKFFETEVTGQGLKEVTAPAPVEIPAADTPRAGAYPIDAELGALAKLPGTWTGNGFNLIARPDKQGGLPFFLELDATKETLEFMPIAGPIPNRGSRQDDVSFLGLTYLQQISDAVTSGGLHIEPGIWLSVPATTVPEAEASVVRKVGYLDPYFNSELPPGIPEGAVANPNLVLTDAIGQDITETVVLAISTKPSGGIENIPFLVENADAISMNAIFWIETVQLEGGMSLQLQYTQTVLLNFEGINWPHISVATLLKF